MPKQVYLKNGTILTLHEQPFAQGGEGDLHKILSPHTFNNQVVKLYKPEKLTPERARKIEYLVAYPPKLDPHDGHYSVVWALETVYDHKGRFLGFTMPMAKGEKLELLCHPRLPKHLGQEWQKFDFKHPKSLELRLKLCFNIAVAISQIHGFGTYVLVDMKPDNIMILPNGLIAVIDIDSVEVIQQGKVLFPAPVATPEYTPPEYYKGIRPEKDIILADWDNFSLAVIFYRLLFGIHPFTGSCNPPFDKCTVLAEMIENGLFANGGMSKHFKMLPAPHKAFERLEKHTQSFFLRCFEEGHTSSYLRPSAEEWCKVLAPKPVVEVNRPLPSLVCLGKTPPARAQAYDFDFPHQLDLPVVNYLHLTEEKGLGAAIGRMFGKNQRQKLQIEIQTAEADLWAFAQRRYKFEQALEKIKLTAQDAQKLILEKEAEKFEQYRQAFQQSVEQIDKEAEQLLREEVELLQTLQQSIDIQLIELNTEVKNLYKNTLTEMELSHNQLIAETQQKIPLLIKAEQEENVRVDKELHLSKMGLVQKLRNIERQQAQAIDNELVLKLSELQTLKQNIDTRQAQAIAKVSETLDDLVARKQSTMLQTRLSAFRIAEEVKQIFNDAYADHATLLENLHKFGIYTAADFKEVTDNFEIRTQTNALVKIPAIVGKRALNLGNWRMRVENNLPEITDEQLKREELAKIYAQFSPEYEALAQNEQQAKFAAQERKKSIPELLQAPRQELLLEEKMLEAEALSERQNLKKHFDLQKQGVENELRALQLAYYQRVAPARADFSRERQALIDKCTSNISQITMNKKNAILDFDQRHAQLGKLVVDVDYKMRGFFEALQTETQRALDQNYQTTQQALQAQQKDTDRYTQNYLSKKKHLDDLQTAYKQA